MINNIQSAHQSILSISSKITKVAAYKNLDHALLELIGFNFNRIRKHRKSISTSDNFGHSLFILTPIISIVLFTSAYILSGPVVTCALMSIFLLGIYIRSRFLYNQIKRILLCHERDIKEIHSLWDSKKPNKTKREQRIGEVIHNLKYHLDNLPGFILGPIIIDIFSDLESEINE